MSYSYEYSTTLTAEDANGVIATSNIFRLSNQLVDYTTTNAILVPALSEVEVQLPGTNSLVAVSISSDNLFDVALAKDINNIPIYTGMFGHSYTRLIKEGAELTVLSIKASTIDAVVKLSVVGLETL